LTATKGRDQFLADAAFAGDQNFRIRAGDALNLLFQLQHDPAGSAQLNATSVVPHSRVL
jgi:hypothetical protein